MSVECNCESCLESERKRKAARTAPLEEVREALDRLLPPAPQEAGVIVVNAAHYEAMKEQIAALENEIELSRTELTKRYVRIEELEKELQKEIEMGIQCELKLSQVLDVAEAERKELAEQKARLAPVDGGLCKVIDVRDWVFVNDQLEKAERDLASAEKKAADLEKHKAHLTELVAQQAGEIGRLYNELNGYRSARDA